MISIYEQLLLQIRLGANDGSIVKNAHSKKEIGDNAVFSYGEEQNACAVMPLD